MPRPIRIWFPGAVYHIFQRGNNKERIFFDDIDRWHFLKLLLESKNEFKFFLFCYVLMNSHFHITVETTSSASISKIMQYILGSYATYFNNRHKHLGHLFQGRFRDILVQKDSYLLQLSRYVHLNPVKAGIVALPQDYKWSSYDIYCGLRKDILVDTSSVLEYFDCSDGEKARQRYKDFVEDGLFELNTNRDWLADNLKRKRFLGTADFINNFLKRGLTPFILDGKNPL